MSFPSQVLKLSSFSAMGTGVKRPMMPNQTRKEVVQLMQDPWKLIQSVSAEGYCPGLGPH